MSVKIRITGAPIEWTSDALHAFVSARGWKSVALVAINGRAAAHGEIADIRMVDGGIEIECKEETTPKNAPEWPEGMP